MFSVLMSVYYKENPSYLSSCLQSLADQTLKANEVVLVEDGPISTELSFVIESFRDVLNIISIRLPNNVGLASALNYGLKKCNHEIIARMDSDDICLPHRFQSQFDYLTANPSLAAISSYVEEFDDSGDVISIRVLPKDSESLSLFAKSRNPLSHPAVMYKRSVILSVGGYPLEYPEDHFLWIKLLQAGFTIGNIPIVLLRMRTGSEFIKRRGFKFLIGEIKLLVYMLKTGFISPFDFFKFSLIRSVLRLVPGPIKVLAYKYFRS